MSSHRTVIHGVIVTKQGRRFFQCEICAKVLVDYSHSELEEHCMKKSHRQAYQDRMEHLKSDASDAAVGREFKKSLDIMACYEEQITLLGHAPWRHHILASCSFAKDGTVSFPVDLLWRYEQKERLSLLELADWKTVSMIRDQENPMPVFGNIGQAQRYLVDHRNDWKQYKAELRHSNAISIVMERVLPFLFSLKVTIE